MKKMNLMFFGFFLFCSNFVWSAPLHEGMNEQRAKEFLAKLSVEKPSYPLDETGLRWYLETRITVAEEIFAGNKSLGAEEIKVLDANWMFMFVMNVLDNNPNARAVYFYPKMVSENLTYMLRKRMKCRVSDEIAEFEKPYEHMLEKVSPEEYTRRLDKISLDEFDELFWQSSINFAKAILEEITTRSNR